MENFEYFNPVNVLFGEGTLNKIGEKSAELGKTALLVSYDNPIFFKDTIDTIHKELTTSGVAYHDFFAVSANPLLSQAKEGALLCRKEKVDLIIGLGGGSVMDCAKIIAAGAVYPHDLQRMIKFSHSDDNDILPTESLPTIMIPTLPATGSEMNPTAVITDETIGKKSYVWAPSCLYPKTAILDPTLTVGLPPYQTACGAFDIIAHIIEAYFNGNDAVYNLDLHDNMQLGVMRAVWDNIPRVMENPKNLQARGVLMWAASIALNGWLTSGTFGFTPMHQMGHVLSARYNATHGATLCCMMVAWLKYFDKHEEGNRYRKFAKDFFGVSAAEAAELFEEKMKGCGIQTRISEFGATENDLASLASEVVAVSFGPDDRLNCLPKLSYDDILNLYKLAL